MYTDTHCHIRKDIYKDIDEIVDKAINTGVTKMINNGTNLESNKEVLELSKKYDSLYPSLGIQPEELDDDIEESLEFIESNINDIVAIGEIGLDYYYSEDSKDKQLEVFEKQLILAEKYNKPVIIHTRNAFDDTLKTIKRHPNVKGVIHCFSDGLEEAREYIKLGYMLGIGGIVTFKNSNLKDVLKNIDISNIVLETDSPYLSPVPNRGKQNNPSNIPYIASYIADIYNISLEELQQKISKNVKNMFNI